MKFYHWVGFVLGKDALQQKDELFYSISYIFIKGAKIIKCIFVFLEKCDLFPLSLFILYITVTDFLMWAILFYTLNKHS